MQADLNVIHASFLKNLSISKLNPMQEAVIGKAANAVNLMLLAPTGTGKTLAFLIAVINQLDAQQKGVQAIIVAPSRELSLQIEQVFKSMKTSYKVTCCYGGHSVKTEQDSLRDAPAVLIATPGRLADHIARQSFDAATVKVVVLDEFDKSLQMGFHEQLSILFKTLSGTQRHILTSATNSEALPDFLPFRKAEVLNFIPTQSEAKLNMRLVRTRSTDKIETLMRLVASFNQQVCLVFCNHRDAVERISQLLKSHKFEHGIFHGAMEQIDREKNLIKFRAGAHNVLISTDLAARGLDIPEIRHIVHYQLPPREEEFIHRNGRTARMHASGQAYLILADDDESLPPYLDDKLPEVHLPKTLILPPPPEYACLYISAGKKDKISKGDIAGMLMKKGQLQADDVGLITILDYASYVGLKRNVVNKVLAAIRDERLKKMKVKIELAS